MAKKEIKNLAKEGVQGASRGAQPGADDAAAIADRQRAGQAAAIRSEVFDDLTRVVDDFLITCALNFDSQESVTLERGPLVEALNIVAPDYFDHLREFSTEIVGTGKKRRFDLEEKHTDMLCAEEQASFLLGLIFAARILGTGPEGIDRLRGIYARVGQLPPA